MLAQLATAAMKTVLIIDDDAQYRRIIADTLQAHGWRVREAGGGQAGLEDVRQHHPEIVLCDLLMPGGNGFHVCRGIRADPTLRATKIVITSGRDFADDRRAAREAGADEYLTKPFPPQTLVALLERLALDASRIAQANRAATVADSTPTRVKFWGVRGSIPSPGPGTVQFGGNTACVEIRTAGEIIILDAGTGLRALGRALVEEFGSQPLNLTLLLTHTHWDHIQGLPFFRPVYQPQCRLLILGYEGARQSLVNVLSGQMESTYFPVLFQELPGNIQIEELTDLAFQVGPVPVKARFANHPGMCVGYRIFTPHGSVAFFPDNEPHTRLHKASPATPLGTQSPPAYAEEQEQQLADFLRGTELLILDSQFDAEEYPSHVGWGHGFVDYAVALALKAEVKRLFLFHHDPEHDDAKIEAMQAHGRKLVTAAGATLQVDAACERTVVELTGPTKLERV